MNEMNELNEMNEVITLFANFINYLNSSYYEYHFTQLHQQARLNLDAIYTEVSKTPQTSPTLDQCISFYNDVRGVYKCLLYCPWLLLPICVHFFWCE